MKKVLFLLAFLPGAALADDAAVRNCRALPGAAERLACYDAMPFGPARAAAPVAAAAQAPAAAIESTIVGDFDGWGPNARIRLANGQVWRVVDDSSAVLPRRANTGVKIERNLFGTMFLKVEGTNSSAKVRRID